ncbi:MAG: CTP synthase (glutamine hydrolyzing) [Candidatus Nanohaloarchaea archaeon]|nr:CTP synthase (glutamine hydrolyzing) [Candidatus Nanohaloarchaea archaeon]
MTEWIFVTGGVLSGLGKGLLSASVAKILQSRGLKVVPVKCDGYLNIDPGTMNPIEHGEVYVLEDGGEVDMDFGHYERFLNVNGRSSWNLTSGKIFKSVIDRERRGDYLGQTVQMIPHVTDEVKDRLRSAAEEEDADVVLVEIGGTVGDIENQIFLEAVRQLRSEEESVLIHLTLVPFLETVGEQKTKPTQHSVKELQEAGLSPDIIVGRSSEELDSDTKEKIALFCDVEERDVISNPDLENVYRLPLKLSKEGIDDSIMEKLGRKNIQAGESLDRWKELVDSLDNPSDTVKIAICGKYTDIDDSYASIEEALKHAGAHMDTRPEIRFVDTEGVESIDEAGERLSDSDAVIIPGGFGSRGVRGKIEVARYCRENSKPLLGLCFGLQLMVVEYARNVCGLEGAHSTEIDEDTSHPVIDILPEQKEKEEKGGTMRLGSCPAYLNEGTKVRDLYGSKKVSERHRHRYEVNPEYHDMFSEDGLIVSGSSEEGRLVEFIELSGHPFYIGTQAHPEFNSSLETPNPLFKGLLEAGREK